jgi:hypothetical protein
MAVPAKTAEKWSGNLRDWLLDGATAQSGAYAVGK